MAHKQLIIALGVILVASPVSAAQPDFSPLAPNPGPPPTKPAPPGTPSTRYCMKVTVTGNIAEPVECWTRAEWAEQGVDVDRDWAKEGVAVEA